MAFGNFWGHQGIIYFYDSEGNELWEMENELNGNLLTPVNWTGDGQDFILLNADVERGGMIDGDGVTVVKFPVMDTQHYVRKQLIFLEMQEMK